MIILIVMQNFDLMRKPIRICFLTEILDCGRRVEFHRKQ